MTGSSSTTSTFLTAFMAFMAFSFSCDGSGAETARLSRGIDRGIGTGNRARRTEPAPLHFHPITRCADTGVEAREVLAQRPFLLGYRAAGGIDDLGRADRLGEIVVSPQPHRLLGTLDGGIAGDHDDLALRPGSLDR